jgi:glycosyltransferase involved in cell wall biosynthesis
MIKIDDMAKIKAPIIWTLHDNWAFTGGCHIKWECEKYKEQCGACPRLGSDNQNDLSRKIWKIKSEVFSKLDNLIIVGLSNWINNCSKESSLLNGKRHINLPNPIFTTIFKPLNKQCSKELWSLPKNKRLILFGANSATSDINKGFKELSNALDSLNYNNIEFVIFGSNEPKESQNFKFKTHYLGVLHDDASLVSLYNAVDMMIVPSLQENLSNAIMESLSCGTPVVSFDIGGNSDMVEHKKNGYLAKPFDSNDLRYGIEWILNCKTYDNLCKNAREKVLTQFDSNIVAKKYIDLYKEIIN